MSFFRSAADSDSDSEPDNRTRIQGKKTPKPTLSSQCTKACKACSGKCAPECEKHCTATYHLGKPKARFRRSSIPSSSANSEDEKPDQLAGFPSSVDERDIPIQERCAAAHCPLKTPHRKGLYGKSTMAVEAGKTQLPAEVKTAVEAVAGEKKKGNKKATVAEKLLVKRFGKVHEML